MSAIEASQQVPRKKFYFSAAIRGDITYERNFPKIIQIISEYGEPLTERSGLYNPLDKNLAQEMKQVKEKGVYRRDIVHWLGEADAVVAEISGASIGVGYEICYAIMRERIPVFCLYHESISPSLIVKLDPSKYVILQQYSNEVDLEKYLRCFLKIVTSTSRIEDIRSAFMHMSKIIGELNPTVEVLHQRIEDLIEYGDSSILQQDLTKFHVLRYRPPEIDFKDVASLASFMLRNIVLQKRWEQLKSQRIGTTYVSGRKKRIIAALSDFYGPTNLLEIFKFLGEDKLRYTREAFTKNIRAYRRIGLFKSSAEPKIPVIRVRSTRFKDRPIFTRTLDGKLQIESSRSQREIMSRLVIPTSHLYYLSEFVDKYGSNSLEALLKKSKQEPWFNKLPSMIHDIDNVDLDSIKQLDSSEEITEYLHVMCKEFWQKQYSSFA